VVWWWCSLHAACLASHSAHTQTEAGSCQLESPLRVIWRPVNATNPRNLGSTHAKSWRVASTSTFQLASNALLEGKRRCMRVYAAVIYLWSCLFNVLFCRLMHRNDLTGARDEWVREWVSEWMNEWKGSLWEKKRTLCAG